jgi:ectoine hydroxylase
MPLIALDQTDLDRFANDGVLLLPWRLSSHHVRTLIEQLPALARRVDTVALEADGKTPRALHGGHAENEVFDRLTRLDALMRPAEQILRDRVYVYQFKVNLKVAFAGDFWPWHQDYSFWAKEDEMPSPRAVTVGIFLDDVTEFNGPMYFIPGSHRSGCHDFDVGQSDAPTEAWRRHVAASLSYQTDRDKVAALAAARGMLAPKGPRGTILLFDSNVVHASPANISPMERRMLFITYNSVTNAPKNAKRPEFLVNRNVTPLVPLEGLELIEPMTA